MLNFSLYLGGHMLVAIMACLFYQLLRREPNLLARREAIFELNHRPERIEAGEAELTASRGELKSLDRRAGEIQAVLVDIHRKVRLGA
jgi:hypothetical protein